MLCISTPNHQHGTSVQSVRIFFFWQSLSENLAHSLANIRDFHLLLLFIWIVWLDRGRVVFVKIKLKHEIRQCKYEILLLHCSCSFLGIAYDLQHRWIQETLPSCTNIYLLPLGPAHHDHSIYISLFFFKDCPEQIRPLLSASVYSYLCLLIHHFQIMSADVSRLYYSISFINFVDSE